MTLWEFFNSQFLNTATMVSVSLVGLYIGNRVNTVVKTQKEKDEDRENEIKYEATIEDKTIEIAAELENEPSIDTDDDHRKEADNIVQTLKSCIREKINKIDGRYKRTYNRIGYRSYPIIVEAMKAREDLDESAADAAIDLFVRWNLYIKGPGASSRIVPKHVYELMEKDFNTFCEIEKCSHC